MILKDYNNRKKSKFKYNEFEKLVFRSKLKQVKKSFNLIKKAGERAKEQ